MGGVLRWHGLILTILLLSFLNGYTQSISNIDSLYVVTYRDTLDDILYSRYYCKDSFNPSVKIKDILIHRYVFNDRVTYVKYRNGLRFEKTKLKNGVVSYTKGYCNSWKIDWYEKGILPDPKSKPEILMDDKEKQALEKYKVKLERERKLAKSMYHLGIYPVMVYYDNKTDEMEVFYLSRYHNGDKINLDYRCRRIMPKELQKY